MSNTKLENIYVNLDALLDTRLGTINKHSKELATAIIASGTYHQREIDDFVGFDRETFKAHYALRDIETLKNSVVTNVIYFLKNLVSELTEQAIQRPYHDGCRVIVNYFPYTLTNEEQAEFESVISTWLRNLVQVELINVPLKDLTPLHCKNNYSAMITYDYEEWLEMHTEAFKSVRLPDINMFAPAIYFNKKPTETELEELVRTSMHPMRAIEVLAAPIIGLRLLDASVFSVLTPP